MPSIRSVAGGGGRRHARAGIDPHEVLPMAFSRPRQAFTMAEALLAGRPTPYEASIAHQAIGIVQREFGDISGAIDHLRRAVRLARRSGSADREADVLATLGVGLVNAGRPRPGLAALDRAVARAHGLTAARVAFRRGGALRLLGQHREAMADLRRAVPALERANDTVWLARALNIRALVHLSLGAADRADADLRRAGELFARTGQDRESAVVVHNRGYAALLAGDLPTALSHLDEAARRLARLGDPMFDLAVDRCDALLAAGLARDALAAAEDALARIDRQRGHAVRRTLLVLAAARAALAADDSATAAELGARAVRGFAAEGRLWWRAHAHLLLLQARFAAGTRSGPLLREAVLAAGRLTELASPEVTRAHLLAGRVALSLGRLGDADRHLAAAARARHRGPALARTGAWLAVALRAEAAGQAGRALRACARGLDVLDAHRLTLGATELRALAGAEGADLTALAQRVCLLAGRPRGLLGWTERGRAAALAVPPVRPPGDRRLQADLTAFREIGVRLDQARAEVADVSRLRREQERLEREIRDRTRRALGRSRREAGAGSRLDVAALLDRLGGERLVQLVDVDGKLHALVCGAGAVRRVEVGPTARAVAEVEFARSALRRLAYRRDAVPDVIEATAIRLEEALLGPAARQFGDGSVTLVPPGRLHGVPWAMLPALRDRTHGVAPSAAVWLRARSARPPARRDVVLVRGPGLRTGGAEIPALAKAYPAATVLENGTATAAAVLSALDGSWLAHIAAHGTYRSDSPLFSSLRVDDGPLTAHDFERLRRAPYRLVLPACDSGQLVPTGADDLLGLATALLPLGTAGIVASLLPVDDEATVVLMRALHEELRGGATLAAALHRARGRLPDDVVHRATGWSFIALGPA